MLKWTGVGFLDGIPARDLEEEELEQYGGRKYLLETGLYIEDTPAKMVMKKSSRHSLTEPPTDKEGE